MDEKEEKRLCKKCGKRLPSSNNFCMYCGYNNNLNDEELESLKNINSSNIHTQNKQELLNKSIASKDRDLIVSNSKSGAMENSEEEVKEKHINEKNSLKNNLIYVFIILDVILISTILLIKSDGLLFEKFTYNLNKYDRVINIDNENFVVLDNNKLKTLGDNQYISSNKNIIDLKKNKVLDLRQIKPGSSTVMAETKDYLYIINLYNSDTETGEKYKLKNATGDVFEDYNNQIYNNKSLIDYFKKKNKEKASSNKSLYSQYSNTLSLSINQLKNTYYILDGSLYQYKNQSKNFLDDTYKRVKILDKSKINMTNPELIGVSSSSKSVILKDSNIIKVFTDGSLIQSISKVKNKNKIYDIKDFKYVLFDNSISSGGTFLFIRQDGSTIEYNYSSSVIDFAEDNGAKSQKFKNIYSKELNKTVDVDDNKYSLLDDNKYSMLDDNTSGFTLTKYKVTYILIVLLAVGILIGILYYFRDFGMIQTTLLTTGTIFCYALILLLYLASKLTGGKMYWEAIKTAFGQIPTFITIGIFIAQIKEIVNYISYKLNIETVYHFVLLLIATTITFLAIGSFTNNILFFAILPGLVWVFLTQNDEDYIKYEINNTLLIRLCVSLAISFLLAFELSYIFNFCQDYLYILVVAFSLACYMVLYNKNTIKDNIKKTMKSFSLVLFLISIYIVNGINSILTFNKDYANLAKDVYSEKYVQEQFNYLVKSVFGVSFVMIITTLIWCVVFGIGLFIVKKFSKKIMDKIENRLLRIFIYMIIMTLFTIVIIIVINLTFRLISIILNALFKFNDMLKLLNFSI